MARSQCARSHSLPCSVLPPPLPTAGGPEVFALLVPVHNWAEWSKAAGFSLLVVLLGRPAVNALVITVRTGAFAVVVVELVIKHFPQRPRTS